jgi:hypothetical protein
MLVGSGGSGSITIEMSTVQSVQFTHGEAGATFLLVSGEISPLGRVGSIAGLVIGGFYGRTG